MPTRSPLHAGGHRRDTAPPDIQDAYNQAHGIVPKTIIKGVREILEISKTAEGESTGRGRKKRKLTDQERAAEIAKLEKGNEGSVQDAGIRVRGGAA